MPDQPSLQSSKLPDAYFKSTPTPFLHMPKIHAQYNRAAEPAPPSQASEAQAAHLQGKAKGDFAAAHEGPREKIAEPKKDYVLTPHGGVEQLVHTELDKAAVSRNQAKDAQMQAWRNVSIGKARVFNTQALAPVHLRPRITPEVLRGAGGRRQRESQDHGRSS